MSNPTHIAHIHIHTQARRTKRANSYLDKFRELMPEIGNALGYVRLIRSGGLNYVSSAVAYIPDIHAVDQARKKNVANSAADAAAASSAVPGAAEGVFKEFSGAVEGEAGLSEATRTTAVNLDSAINDLTLKFAAGTDFFQLLGDVFAPQLRAEVYAIVPPLIINFVEHMLAAKDKLVKGKRQVGGAFSDDGFSLGIAYGLRLLEQVRVYVRGEGKGAERGREGERERVCSCL